MLDAARSEIAEQLCSMLIPEYRYHFDLYDQAILDQHVGVVVAKHGAIGIEHAHGVLLLALDPCERQAMCQCALVDPFEVTASQMYVNRIRDLSDPITEFEDVVHDSSMAISRSRS